MSISNYLCISNIKHRPNWNCSASKRLSEHLEPQREVTSGLSGRAAAKRFWAESKDLFGTGWKVWLTPPKKNQMVCLGLGFTLKPSRGESVWQCCQPIERWKHGRTFSYHMIFCSVMGHRKDRWLTFWWMTWHRSMTAFGKPMYTNQKVSAHPVACRNFRSFRLTKQFPGNVFSGNTRLPLTPRERSFC